MLKKKKDGYVYINSTGKEYILLEGMSIGADSTSDICFIFDDDKVEVVGFFYGVPEIYENDEIACGIIKRYVDEYEERLV